MRRIAVGIASALCFFLAISGSLGGCSPAAPGSNLDNLPTSDVEPGADTEAGGSTDETTDTGGSTDASTDAGVLQFKAVADSLGDATLQSAQSAPDDVDVKLTPSEYTVAFKRLVLKQVDNLTDATLAEVEVFSADAVENSLVVDLLDSEASDVLSAEDLPAGTYNKVDIEVFYLDMTIPTLYPGQASHEIPYRMVFDAMGLLEPRDFLLHLQPAWFTEAGAELRDAVTAEGWYWLEMGNPDRVLPVSGAAARPPFPVLDLFADEAFWGAEHRVLQGGTIDPPLVYDPQKGGVLTIRFDVEGTFSFKDYHDETTAPDGLWEIRKDAGIHPFPPDFVCVPSEAAEAGSGEKLPGD